jgi:endogenous inhibitor of DNA gyrase (YacG/DUF329 family)
LPLGFAFCCLVLKLSAFELTRFLYAAVRKPITLKLGNKTQIPAEIFLENFLFYLIMLSLPHTRTTCWANRLEWQLAQLCIFTAHVGKTTRQQHNWQNHLHFPPFCSKSHEEIMVSHWLIDSSSSALSSQHPQTLRFFPHWRGEKYQTR